MYILDNKTNLGAYIIPTGSSNKLIAYNELQVIPPAFVNPQLSINNDGTIIIGDALNPANLIINAGIDFDFKQIFGVVTNYDLAETDYAIEIISPSFLTVTLPSAFNIGGRTYLVSNGSGIPLHLQPQLGENIDGRTFLELRRLNDHTKIFSNGQDSWYIV